MGPDDAASEEQLPDLSKPERRDLEQPGPTVPPRRQRLVLPDQPVPEAPQDGEEQ
jgi:hypothetical protein